MKLAVMQPYFFPYLGYFDLINYANKWVVFDTAQFVKRGWGSRNRILHPKSGWSYISVPISRMPRETKFSEILIYGESNWQARIFAQLEHYKRTAPFYSDVTRILRNCLNQQEKSLVCLNINCLRAICRYIGIAMNFSRLSELDIEKSECEAADDYILRLSAEIGATEYVNLPGGIDLYSKSKFKAKGINLTFRQIPKMDYETSGYRQEANLSVLDILMWNSPEQVLNFLNKYKEEK